MGKWMLACAVLLGSSVSLAASINKLTCANGFQDSLEIARDFDAATVTAVLNSNGAVQSYEGAILPTGKFEMKPTVAEERVALALVRPRDHGGRCGRCAIDDTPPAINAQLVVGTVIFTFQCQ